ncbi:ABC transporter permease [Cohnella sp. CIP 111063]|jgi:ABC-type sugar transport systems, permease components|uniref:carbohydrate ABC transporter permease n=1 Tax=unclassified Cohnella TaxID=2636738 RepID=UPI000B8BFAD0|nr:MULTISPECIES: sugar ABC transporter permease [unclassified Cohnella]OXS56253.1 ABC transporter permease [Cohnella sp. CIP 111063]PRX67892.1 N-acetylglucosamine transport system permease protein [Cohnella sp. SGD-V74]
MSRQLQRKLFIAAFLVPTFLFFSVFVLYPVAKGAHISLFDWSGSSEHMTYVGLDNFKEIVRDPIVWKAIGNDYFLVLGKTIGIVLLATFFAVAVTRLRIRGASFFRIAFFIPNIISIVVIGVLWRFVYNPSIGFLNSFLSLFAAEPVNRPWLGEEGTALWSILWPSIWAGIGFYFLLLVAAIMGIPASLYEAAEIDGAKQGRQFWTITLPLVWEQVKVSVLHIVMTTLNGSFVMVLLMTEGGPDNSTQVLGSYLYQMGFRQFHMGYAAALGVVILIVSLLTTLVLQRLLRRDTVEYS